MKKFILLSVCFILAFSTMFAQERTNRGRRNEQQKQEVVSPPVVNQNAGAQHENLPKLAPEIERVLNSLELNIVPEGELEITYLREVFGGGKLIGNPSWIIQGTIKDVPGDKLYGAYFNLTIGLAFNSNRTFQYDGTSVKVIDSDFSNHNVEGSVNDPVVMKKFYDEFNSFSYHLTGDFLLKPITLEFLRRAHESNFTLLDGGNLEVTFRLPPRNEGMEEINLIVNSELQLQKLEHNYRFRDQSEIKDSWIIKKK